MPNSSEQPAIDTTARPAIQAQASGGTDRLRGIALMVLAVGLFSVMDALVKWLGRDYSTVQILFFRSVCAFIPLGFLVFRGGIAQALRMHSPVAHLVRSLVGLVAISTFFYGFARLPLADVIAISFAAPIFVTALSVPLLGEKVGRLRWSAVLVGFLGVMIMLQPGTGLFNPISAVPLFGTIFYALAMIMVRRLSHTETAASIVFYFTLTCALVSGVLLPFQWTTPDLPGLALLIAVGLVGGLAQITITKAFSLAEIAVVIPFEYSAIIWGALFGYFIWGEVPGNNIWVGVAVVTASGLFILYREASLGLPRGTARRLQAKR